MIVAIESFPIRKGADEMASCREMELGEVYMCAECGLEVKVVAECKEVGTPATDLPCHSEGEECTLSCCGKELVKKP